MRKKLNLKLYFLFIGIFLIFNLSCESEDLASIVGVDTSTTYYTLSLNSIVCDDNKSPKCDENYIDYNDWMVVDKTIFTAVLESTNIILI